MIIEQPYPNHGYLLPWDQKAYWATAVGTNIAGTTPLIGGAMVSLLRGGSELGAATLARFYAFHVLWLPVLLVVLAALHLVMLIRQGIAARPRDLEVGAPKSMKDPAYPAYYHAAYAATKRAGVRFWPDVLGKDASCRPPSAVLVIVVCALAFGAPLEAPADPTDTAYVPRPEWYFLPIYQLLSLVPGSMESLVAVGLPTALLLTMLALPFFDRGSTRNLLHRPFAMVSLAAILGGSGFLIGAAGRDAVPEVAELAGPLSSTQRAGAALYQSQQCGGCHQIAGQGGEAGPDLTTVGLRHSPGWLHSFLEHPERFHADCACRPTDRRRCPTRRSKNWRSISRRSRHGRPDAPVLRYVPAAAATLGRGLERLDELGDRVELVLRHPVCEGPHFLAVALGQQRGHAVYGELGLHRGIGQRDQRWIHAAHLR